MQIVLPPAQLQLVAGMMHESVALFANPFHGWISQKINCPLARAMRILVEGRLVVQEINHILIHNKLSQLIDNIIRFYHFAFLQIVNNRDCTQYFGFSRMKDAQTGTFISCIGINLYALQEQYLSATIGEYVRIMGIHTLFNPFQLLQQNMMRLLDQNGAMTQPICAYDFWCV